MANYWLDRKSQRNFKLLEGIDRKWNRCTCAVLMESVRLQYEVGNDEEYQAYLKDFRERTRKALENCNGR